MKCDFCDKEAVGYLSYQCAIYCLDHEAEAQAIEDALISEIEKTPHEERYHE